MAERKTPPGDFRQAVRIRGVNRADQEIGASGNVNQEIGESGSALPGTPISRLAVISWARAQLLRTRKSHPTLTKVTFLHRSLRKERSPS
ncbi:MAG TPA: hypothetical protein VK041_03985 [Opitutales bacterium]|nr:hypothetical protein [Opitutales bacterium]